MRQAIVTKYLGPTNNWGSRVKAICDAGSVTLSWDHALDVDGNHRQAAMALAEKFGWTGRWFGGGMPSKSDGAYVFVLVGTSPAFEIADPVETCGKCGSEYAETDCPRCHS